MATILKKLTVDADNLGIESPILKAEIWNRRSYLADSFVTSVDIHKKITDIQNNDLVINLLRNTYGSFYELVLFGAANFELLRCFFIMPDTDCNLSDLRLLTAYPEASAIATSFLMLSDTPDSYFQQGGKVVAVREDEKGLEFVTCHCGGNPEPIVISCEGATDKTSCIEFSDNGLFDVYINDMNTPYLTDATPQQIASLEDINLEAIECDCTKLPSYVVLDSGDPFRELSKPYVLTVNGVDYPSADADSYYFAVNNYHPELNGVFSMYIESVSRNLYLQNSSKDCLYISDTEGLNIVLGVSQNA